MARKIFHHLRSEAYQHPYDRKALTALEKTPGLSLLLKKINEYGIDRLLRLQTLGNELLVNSDNFPKLYDAFVETCQILDISPSPELYLYRGTGHITTYAIGVDRPLVGVNLEAMEWLTYEELLFVLGHELARVQGRYLAYQQLAFVMPLLKGMISSTTLGLGGLAANGIEVGLYNWIIMTKFTADRAGLLVCQDINIAMTALMKLGGLPSEYLNPEVIRSFFEQAREFNIAELGRLDQVTKFLSFMEFRQPWMVMRASELLRWVDSGVYDYWMQSETMEERSEQTEAEQKSEQTDDTEMSETSEVLPKADDEQDWQFLGSW